MTELFADLIYNAGVSGLSKTVGGSSIVMFIVIKTVMTHFKKKKLIEKVIENVDNKDYINKAVNRKAKDIEKVDVHSERF